MAFRSLRSLAAISITSYPMFLKKIADRAVAFRSLRVPVQVSTQSVKINADSLVFFIARVEHVGRRRARELRSRNCNAPASTASEVTGVSYALHHGARRAVRRRDREGHAAGRAPPPPRALLGAAGAARRPVRAAEAGLLSALGPLRKPTPETPTPETPTPDVVRSSEHVVLTLYWKLRNGIAGQMV